MGKVLHLKETYSEHIGIRLTPTMVALLAKWAKQAHLSPACFARQVILNHLGGLEAKKN